MATLTKGIPHVFGVVDPLPLSGFPPGRIKLRMRPMNFAFAFVKTEEGIRKFAIQEKDGLWIPSFEQSRNQTFEN